MKNSYFDFHSKDEEIEYSAEYEQYCESRNADKKDSWLPFLSFPITKYCNFHCLYCGIGGEATASKNKYISLEMIKEYVEYGLSKGLKKFRITGGEPFLHPKIKEILQYFSELGVYCLVNTNGSLIEKNRGWISELSQNVKFAVSLDTLHKEKSKIINGVDCHDDVVKGLKILSESKNLLRINMVVNKHNYDEIYEMIDFCSKLKCDLKILDVVSVPVPFNEDRQDFYREVNSLEKEFSLKCDKVFSHEYTRGFGTPCFRYKFGDVFVTVKNSKKGSHYDLDKTNGICANCKYFPCHEGLYDLFCLADGRLCSCRWTEEQQFGTMPEQMQWLIKLFKRSEFVYTGKNDDMTVRDDLKSV